MAIIVRIDGTYLDFQIIVQCSTQFGKQQSVEDQKLDLFWILKVYRVLQ